ncbi:MAG TPA: tRNA uridine-5-carboxymethylaminomethyl(34) synthesis GTPase MnmE, partial [Terriglobales bacterium]|nr:tRNA uridine-5-carboxymethylaminomethyl(34) synthesis GTPase MnmE [Terriglobales bacterium]
MAVATPPGTGALGIVRLSGPDALTLASALLPAPQTLATQPTHTVRRVSLRDPASHATLDDALCTVMRAPATYTGEDVVELSCHGSPALLAMLVERLRIAGARLADPGEFTRRAYLNGRMELAR